MTAWFEDVDKVINKEDEEEEGEGESVCGCMMTVFFSFLSFFFLCLCFIAASNQIIINGSSRGFLCINNLKSHLCIATFRFAYHRVTSQAFLPKPQHQPKQHQQHNTQRPQPQQPTTLSTRPEA